PGDTTIAPEQVPPNDVGVPEPDRVGEPSASKVADEPQAANSERQPEPMPTGPVAVVLMTLPVDVSLMKFLLRMDVAEMLAPNGVLLVSSPWTPKGIKNALNVSDALGFQAEEVLKTGDAAFCVIARRGEPRPAFGLKVIGEEGVADWRDLKALREWVRAG